MGSQISVAESFDNDGRRVYVGLNVILKSRASVLKLVEDEKHNFIRIGYCLCAIDFYYDSKTSIDDVYGYAQSEFGFSVRNTQVYMQVYEAFGVYTGTNRPEYLEYKVDCSDVSLAEKYKDFSLSQLVEMCSIPKDKLDFVTPDMSVRDIRQYKKVLASAPRELPPPEDIERVAEESEELPVITEEQLQRERFWDEFECFAVNNLDTEKFKLIKVGVTRELKKYEEHNIIADVGGVKVEYIRRVFYPED